MGVESILLYYSYVDLKGQQKQISEWYLYLCTSLKLVGRVRVAVDGVNVTVGGSHAALEEHIKAVKDHASLGNDIDFKLAKSNGPLNEDAVRESNFDRLRVVICKEVVSLGAGSPCHPDELPEKTGIHLRPEEWHAAMQQPDQGSTPILLDTRNIYETSVGHFEAQGCELVDPQLRHFSEFPSWLQANKASLANRKVMMYCTGGVRCERASALVKSLGPDFQDVSQLKGGIQRYLEQFPDGGLFRGKNFVFDERVLVAPEAAAEDVVVGQCLQCNRPCDDYRARMRCTHCRLLVLICTACKDKVWKPLECELCRKRKHEVDEPSGQPRKLRILCLHGFRSTAVSMKAQNSSFFKSISDLADLYFLDGPHKLAFLYKPDSDSQKGRPKTLPNIDISAPRRAWVVDPEHQVSDADLQEAIWKVAPENIDSQQFLRQSAGWSETEARLLEAIENAGPFDGILGLSQGAAVAGDFAAKLQMDSQLGKSQGLQCARMVDNATDSQLADLHPDMTSNNSHTLEDPQEGQSRYAVGNSGGLSTLEVERESEADPEGGCCHGTTACSRSHHGLKFVVIGSGYELRTPEHSRLKELVDVVRLPSLHIYRSCGDRQVSSTESEVLCEWCSSRNRHVLKHNKGHTLPADKVSVSHVRTFLKQFL